MEGLTRLVTESLARHGFDRPLDYRRLHWSHWFRCESLHSLLSVPSKPGVFALAEEIVDFARGSAHVGTGASPVQAERSSAVESQQALEADLKTTVEERRFSAASSVGRGSAALAAEARRRLLAVTQFFDADDMAFTLDRMLTWANPLRARLSSGRYFIRYVVIEDQSQRLSIANALNQWIANAGEKVSGIGAHFASSLEINETNVARTPSSARAAVAPLDSGAAANIHCPSPLPSGF
jgi:hypothetical protein